MTTPHPHAAQMAEYAQDAAIDGEAWKNWEYLVKRSEQWRDCERDPSWDQDCEYRRKPEPIKTIKVTTHSGKVYEFPEPLRVVLANHADYFLVDISQKYTVAKFTWDSDSRDLRWIEKGICHLTREAAEQHAAVLLAVNRGE